MLSLDVIIFFLCLTVYENEVEICKKSAVGGRDGKEHHTQHKTPTVYSSNVDVEPLLASSDKSLS